MGGDRDSCLDASVAKGFAFLEPIQSGKEMLVRIVAMLTKPVVRFDPHQYRVRESASGLAAPFEDDDEYPRKGRFSWVRNEHFSGSARCGKTSLARVVGLCSYGRLRSWCEANPTTSMAPASRG